MLNPDPRGYRVALLADGIANEDAAKFNAVESLEKCDFGFIVLPPSDFHLSSIGKTIEYVVDDLLDYRNSGYSVVVIGSSQLPEFGVWMNHVNAELRRRDVDDFAVFDVVNSMQSELEKFLVSQKPTALNKN
ncbi:unannotated protein [freshwater metagenome]|uniref:Unannotated protein n=1 Tax=freshwater metagenome TaxID=449393 RepID=A0A6J6RMW6_9ZZZZ|nr:hypothetical protein [Actinomycetota bacterium]MSX15413.1 hypothetical protein [Actinomycetota bacterium]MSX36439.1 hypothetical protein [Actinomycetota bacterium]MSX77046.1 hypothetical protein [Actinomycetota bacterium]MSZ71621.1 hypothetical protein [Actinomycetota bacterium]